jgi:hypothetical protein
LQKPYPEEPVISSQKPLNDRAENAPPTALHERRSIFQFMDGIIGATRDIVDAIKTFIGVEGEAIAFYCAALVFGLFVLLSLYTLSFTIAGP